jgi:hypothetical protein
VSAVDVRFANAYFATGAGHRTFAARLSVRAIVGSYLYSSSGPPTEFLGLPSGRWRFPNFFTGWNSVVSFRCVDALRLNCMVGSRNHLVVLLIADSGQGVTQSSPVAPVVGVTVRLERR